VAAISAAMSAGRSWQNCSWNDDAVPGPAGGFAVHGWLVGDVTWR
jgi:hypothetical protein